MVVVNDRCDKTTSENVSSRGGLPQTHDMHLRNYEGTSTERRKRSFHKRDPLDILTFH